MYLCIYITTYLRIYVCLYLFIYVYVSMYLTIHLRIYVCPYLFIHLPTYTSTHTCSHKRKQPQTHRHLLTVRMRRMSEVTSATGVLTFWFGKALFAMVTEVGTCDNDPPVVCCGLQRRCMVCGGVLLLSVPCCAVLWRAVSGFELLWVTSISCGVLIPCCDLLCAL